MSNHSGTRYWVSISTEDNVKKCTAGGYLQGDQKTEPLLNDLSKGDFLLFYSPRTRYRDGKPLQHFTAMGTIEDDKAYPTAQGETTLWRRKVDFLSCGSSPIEPLVPSLNFIPDKEKWGLPFKKGLFPIDQADFEKIAQAMGIETEH